MTAAIAIISQATDALVTIAFAAHLTPGEFEVGEVGELTNPSTGNHWNLVIDDIIDANSMLVSIANAPAFLIAKYPTRGLVDGKKINLKGAWKVVGTKKVGGKTRYVLEPQKK